VEARGVKLCGRESIDHGETGAGSRELSENRVRRGVVSFPREGEQDEDPGGKDMVGEGKDSHGERRSREKRGRNGGKGGL